MTDDKILRMQQLVRELNEASDAYYNGRGERMTWLEQQGFLTVEHERVEHPDINAVELSSMLLIMDMGAMERYLF